MESAWPSAWRVREWEGPICTRGAGSESGGNSAGGGGASLAVGVAAERSGRVDLQRLVAVGAVVGGRWRGGWEGCEIWGSHLGSGLFISSLCPIL